MEPWIRRAVLMGFPAGFAAAAPFLAELSGHVPFIVAGVGLWDFHTHILDAADAGEVGRGLGPLWLLLELGLLGVGGRRRWLAALVVTVALAPVVHWLACPWTAAGWCGGRG